MANIKVITRLRAYSCRHFPFTTPYASKGNRLIMPRKRKLSEKLKSIILDLIADSFTLRQIFSKPEGELFKKGIEYSWSSFRKELIEDNDLMSRYQKAKELCIDLELSSLKDKRLELESKIESGQIDGKAGQNLTNLYKILTAHTQWSASKLAKKYSKSSELTLKGSSEPINISWTKN